MTKVGKPVKPPASLGISHSTNRENRVLKAPATDLRLTPTWAPARDIKTEIDCGADLDLRNRVTEIIAAATSLADSATSQPPIAVNGTLHTALTLIARGTVTK